MIRTFDWRDVALMHRVSKRGLCLYARMSCTRGPNALLNALKEVLPMTGQASTVVYRSETKKGRAAIGQLHHNLGDHHARIAFIGPAEVLDGAEGIHLLDALVETAGIRGAHHLLAEVNEESYAFESLRQAGFAIYARQRIWRLAGGPRVGDKTETGAWRSLRKADYAAVLALYHNLVPPLVQQIEPPPSRGRDCRVHWGKDEVIGYMQLQHGPLGSWIQPFFHPSVEDPEDLLKPILKQVRDDRRSPLYVSVRSYQGWMDGMLHRLGFDSWQDQAVMVKHLVAQVRKPVLKPLRAMEGTRPEPTSPIVRVDDRRSSNRAREST
jgi:hypothetical protein